MPTEEKMLQRQQSWLIMHVYHVLRLDYPTAILVEEQHHTEDRRWDTTLLRDPYLRKSPKKHTRCEPVESTS